MGPRTRSRHAAGMRIALRFALVLASALLLVSCATTASRVRTVTDAPGWRWLDEDELRGTMHRLGRLVSQLDGLLAGPRGDVERQQVLDVLTQMEALGAELEGAAAPSGHPRFDEAAPRFRSFVTTAKHGVEQEPPSYYAAGTVTGACLYCHGAISPR